MQPTVNEKGSPPDASTSDIMLVQESMAVLDLYQGAIDGIPGKQTMRAVRAYKRSQKLPSNNTIDAEFVSYLRNAF